MKKRQQSVQRKESCPSLNSFRKEVQIVEKYGEVKGVIRLPISKAIKEELETYGKLFKDTFRFKTH